MNYRGQDIDIKSGDLILFYTKTRLSDPTTLLSAAIRFFTKCHYNHVAVVVNDWLVPFINEALASGVICRPMAQHLDRYADKICVIRYDQEIVEKDFCVKANSKLGIPYAFGVLVFIQLWFRLTGKWIGRTKEHAENAMVCSEYAAWCYGLDNWWTYSAKEFLTNPKFKIIYQEQ